MPLDRSASPSPTDAAAPSRAADLDRLLVHADLADLARLARQVLSLADSAARPWRPKTMHEWLT